MEDMLASTGSQLGSLIPHIALTANHSQLWFSDESSVKYGNHKLRKMNSE